MTIMVMHFFFIAYPCITFVWSEPREFRYSDHMTIVYLFVNLQRQTNGS